MALEVTVGTALVAGFAAAAALHAAQNLPLLRIKVTVVDADNRVRPVPRHALLISNNPSSAEPRRVVTGAEGMAEVRLRPGNYTVESDEPLIFQGRAYEWRETLDVPAGRDTLLELTAAKAAVTTSGADSSPSALLMQWQGSIVSIWSPTARGAGFVIDRRGLVVTNQRVIGSATSAEVQLTATRKVAARVVVNDAARDVAVLWLNPATVSSMTPVKLGYAQDGKPALAGAQEVFAIELAAIEQRILASGRVSRVDARTIESDVRLDRSSAGTPLMTATGDVVGITVADDPGTGAYNGRLQAVRIDEARSAIAEAGRAVAGAAPPAERLLPVEPLSPVSEDALKAMASRRAGNLSAYQLSAADFDVTFITPVLIVYGTQHPSERALADFGNWSDYVAAIPPVLLVRATPKTVEGFWASVGRAAARTQGVALPPFTHVKSSFDAMRLYCGESEVTPIHPFKIERRIDSGNGLYEGLYVFDPAAIGSSCGKVRLVLFSEKAPDRGDDRAVEPKILEQVAKDFASAPSRQ